MSKPRETESATTFEPRATTAEELAGYNRYADNSITPQFTEGFNGAQSAFGTIDGLNNTAHSNGLGRQKYAEGFQDTIQGLQNPFAQKQILDQLITNSGDEAQSRLGSAFGGAGAFGGSLHRSNLGRDVAAGTAGVQNDFFQRGSDRALDAAKTGQTALFNNNNVDIGLDQTQIANLRQRALDQYNLGAGFQGVHGAAREFAHNAAIQTADRSTNTTETPSFWDTAFGVANAAASFIPFAGGGGGGSTPPALGSQGGNAYNPQVIGGNRPSDYYLTGAFG